MCDASFSINCKVAQNIISYWDINEGVIKQIKSQLKVKPAAQFFSLKRKISVFVQFEFSVYT